MMIHNGTYNSTQILNKSTVDLILSSQVISVPSQGLIWHQYWVDGRMLWGHSGSYSGCRTCMYFEPKTQIGVIEVTNGEYDGHHEILRALFNFSQTPMSPEIHGPEHGVITKELEYSFVASDPDGDDVYYYIDWGDFNAEEWIGPYASGEEITINHTWDELGTYTIVAKAKDGDSFKSDFSDPFTVTVQPFVTIQPVESGLFRVSAILHNNDDDSETSVHWSIMFSGGAFIGKEASGDIYIVAGDEATINSKFILGFGPTEITVTAEVAEYTYTMKQDGFVFLFYIKVTPNR